MIAAVGVLWLVVVVVWWRVVGRWRAADPWLWWRRWGVWRTMFRVPVVWSRACRASGLAVMVPRGVRLASQLRDRGNRMPAQRSRPVTGKVLSVSSDECSLTLHVAMLPGQTPGEYERAGEGFAHALRVHAVRVSSPQPGRVALRAVGFDPLERPAAWPAVVRAVRADIADRAPGDGVLVVPVGIREDGRAWSVDLRQVPHHLVTGATRSGKSTLTVRLVHELAGRPVALVGIDAKGGMELGPLAGRLTALATDQEQASDLISALRRELGTRTRLCARHGARSVWDLPDALRPPVIVVIVDEIAELLLSAGDRDSKAVAISCGYGLARLAQLGAAVGIHLWVCGQRFGSDLGPGATLIRAQLAGRVCHRVSDVETAHMTLAGLPPDAMGETVRIPMDLPGVAVVGDDSGTWYRARSVPVPEDELRARVTATSPLTPVIPTLTETTTKPPGTPPETDPDPSPGATPDPGTGTGTAGGEV